MESSRTSLASRTRFEVLGFEASSPRKLPCPRLEDITIFWIVKILQIARKKFLMTFFEGSPKKNFWRPFYFWRSPEKNFWTPYFLFLENTCACVLGPWPRAFLSSASRGAVLVLGSDFFCVLGLEPCVLDFTSGAYRHTDAVRLNALFLSEMHLTSQWGIYYVLT